MRLLLLLTVASFPVSVTLHHGLVSLCVLIVLYNVFRERKLPQGGLLANPIHLFNFSTVASALLYMPEKIREALSSSFLRYGYLSSLRGEIRGPDFFHLLNRILLLEGILLLPVFAYNLFVMNRYKLLWGNMFKVAEIYALFTLVSLSLALYRRSWIYFLISGVFFAVMMSPARRAEILGLVLTVFLIVALYMKRNRAYLKQGMVFLAAVVVLLTGGFLYFAEHQKDPRFVLALEVLKGQRELNEETLDRLSTTRWNNLKASLVVVGRDFSEGNIVPLLVGHGIYGGGKLTPPPPNGLPYYEGIGIVLEFIQRGALGVIALILIFLRSLKVLFSLDLGRRESLMLLPFVSYMVFYNFSAVFTPYVNATLPVALLMFGLAEGYLRQSRERRI